MRVRITTFEPMLGAWPANQDIARDFVASKSPDAATIEEEVAAIGVEAVVEKGKTVFCKLDDGTPFLWDYAIKGFFKDSCSALARAKTPKSSKIKAYKKIIDGLVFVEPRRVPVLFEGEITDCQRPLRAQTAQGERISLAISEEVPAGAKLEFDVVLFDEVHEALVREWLDYGKFRGLGQWRNSGKGRFYWEELDGKGNVIGGNMPQ